MSVDEKLKEIAERLWKIESNIDLARDYLEEVFEYLKVKEDINDFLYNLSENKEVPSDIRIKASALWRKT